MQVKKYEASSVIEALQQVKKDLGPDAIVLSTQEVKKSVTGAKKFVVVAAVTDGQLRKKELAEQKLGKVFEGTVQKQSAQKQKMFIENVYEGAQRQYEKRHRKITQTRYIEIDDSAAAAPATVKEEASSNTTRVKEAAQEAFKSSLSSQFFKKAPRPVEEELLPDEMLQAIAKPRAQQKAIPENIENRLNRLASAGVNSEICQSLKERALREIGSHGDRKAIVDSWFAKWILSQIQVVEKRDESQLEFFVGPHGSGKTTALVKLATHYVVNERKSVAIVTSDLNKVGAVEQLRVYSRILNAPVFVLKDMTELDDKLVHLQSYDKIFIDTPGVSLSNMTELDFMRSIVHMSSRFGKTIHLVVSALTKSEDLGGLLKRFRVSEFDDLIISNIDQTSQHGILLNIQEKINRPFHSFGIGSDIVDGFEFASRERVLDLIFKLTQRTGERGHDSRL